MSDTTYPLLSALMIVQKPIAKVLNFVIDSFLSQTYPNKELIIINNADSPYEATELILDAYPNVFLIDTPIRLSAGQARNYAISAANGMLLAQFDYDCWHHPDRLFAQIVAMTENDAQVCLLSNAMQYSFISDRISLWQNDKNAILNTMVYKRPEKIDYPDSNKNEEFGLLIKMVESGYRPISLQNPQLMCKMIGLSFFNSEALQSKIAANDQR